MPISKVWINFTFFFVFPLWRGIEGEDKRKSRDKEGGGLLIVMKKSQIKWMSLSSPLIPLQRVRLKKYF